MDNALFNRIAERPQVVPQPDHHSASALRGKSGPCISCRADTESLARFNGKAVSLCPPCAQGIRDGGKVVTA